MGIRDVIFVGIISVGGAGLLASSLRMPTLAKPAVPMEVPEVNASTINAAFQRGWDERKLTPAPKASELAILRRISLALTGMVPSLEEIRRFESFPEGRRVSLALEERLADRRTADYLAERFARAFVGTEGGPFLLFRRRRFATWLGDAIHEGRPYDAIVRDMIADRGLWTDHPATNFITVTRDEITERPDPERLAARVARACLGARIDCAKCHDHPFESWKQDDFRGLAAFFGAIRSDLRGVREVEATYAPLDRKTKEPTPIAPRFPFLDEIATAEGTPRERLAAWVTDPRNKHFAQASVNRVWALMLGRALVEPVDDLQSVEELPEPLVLLAEDFSSHGYDLRRLIRTIAATDVCQLESIAEGDDEAVDDKPTWASFPLTRLRPEQVAGSIYQAGSVTTLGPERFWLARLTSYNARNDFVRRYGDTGEDEFDSRGGTIPQRLLLMNGDLVTERIKDDLFNASNQIAELARDDRTAVDVAYLAVLTRRPTPEEAEHFEGRLQGASGKTRKERLTDLSWTLLNTSEFSWNH